MSYLKLAEWSIVLLLLYSAVVDIQRREIPLAACLLADAVIVVALLWFGAGWATLGYHLLAGLILAGLYFVNALFFRGGGGDCLLAFSIGLALGVRAGLIIVILSSLCLGVFHIMLPKKLNSYPLAPFLFLATLLYFRFTGGI